MTGDNGKTTQEQERWGEWWRQQKWVGNDKMRRGDDGGEAKRQSDSGAIRNRPIYIYRGSECWAGAVVYSKLPQGTLSLTLGECWVRCWWVKREEERLSILVHILGYIYLRVSIVVTEWQCDWCSDGRLKAASSPTSRCTDHLHQTHGPYNIVRPSGRYRAWSGHRVAY